MQITKDNAKVGFRISTYSHSGYLVHTSLSNATEVAEIQARRLNLAVHINYKYISG